jgi:hypothetical protein
MPKRPSPCELESVRSVAWLMFLLVPPDRTGWIDPAGRLTDPDSHVPVGSVISCTPGRTRRQSARRRGTRLACAGGQASRGVSSFDDVGGPGVARQFGIQPFGKRPTAPRRNSVCEILPRLSSLSSSTKRLNAPCRSSGNLASASSAAVRGSGAVHL